MAQMKLDRIVLRQRAYLVKDVLMASLAAVILAIQVTVLSGANVPMAKLDERASPRPVAGSEPILAGDTDHALATVRAAMLPDT